MAQMPEEGRKFGIVDSYWKDIMGEAVSNELFPWRLILLRVVKINVDIKSQILAAPSHGAAIAQPGNIIICVNIICWATWTSTV